MDSSYDKTNESLYRYQESVHGRIVDICDPLDRHLGISLFCHSRVYLDGRFFHIANQLNYSKALLEAYLHEDSLDLNGLTFLKNIETPEQFSQFLYPEVPDCKSLEIVHNYGFRSGVGFMARLPDYIECWSFFGNKESSNLRDSYICNHKPFLKFIQFFRTSASDLELDKKDMSKLGFFKDSFRIIGGQSNQNETTAINAFLEELHKKSKYLHKIKPEFTYLTSREQECLSYLAKGDTAKEVARNLEISPRTVEIHLKTIKCKTGFHSRSQLVKFFLNHFS